MRRWLSRLVLVLSLSVIPAGFAVPPALAQKSAHQQDPQKITVYVTRTGKKYHRDGCRFLSRSKIPMSLKEAAARYGPCSVCRPPVLKQ